MKMVIFLILIFFRDYTFAAEKNLILIGGGGEPLGEKETQFDMSMEGVGDFYLKNRDYQTTVNFNGGRSKTELKIKSKFSGADITQNFSAQSYDKLIQETIKQLETGQIPSGGKILLFIDSHGGEKNGQTHSIATSNSAMTNLNSGGGSMVSLDKLKRPCRFGRKEKCQTWYH